MEEEFYTFSDEKGSGLEQYWGVCLVTGPQNPLNKMKRDLLQICEKRSLEFLEWKAIKGDGKRQKAAIQYMEKAVNLACEKNIRIDVLVWNMQDSRHSVAGRKDIRNLERMYYKVLTHSWRIWGKSRWRLYPHTTSQIDWESISRCLSRTKLNKPVPYFIELFQQEHGRFRIVELKTFDSKQNPLIQLADLFVGMGCFSVDKKDRLQKYVEKQNHGNQLTLSLPIKEDESDTDSESNADKARFELISYLDKLCKRKILGVSLRTKGYLWTPDPRNPINFWLYESQHELDKAPTS